MQTFTSSDLQKHLKTVSDAASIEPTVWINRGQPRLVLMSAEGYWRLKVAPGQPVAAAVLPIEPLMLEKIDDILGYDSADVREAAQQMSDDALLGPTAAVGPKGSGC